MPPNMNDIKGKINPFRHCFWLSFSPPLFSTPYIDFDFVGGLFC